jgi:hypothetical protein
MISIVVGIHCRGKRPDSELIRVESLVSNVGGRQRPANDSPLPKRKQEREEACVCAGREGVVCLCCAYRHTNTLTSIQATSMQTYKRLSLF